MLISIETQVLMEDMMVAELDQWAADETS